MPLHIRVILDSLRLQPASREGALNVFAVRTQPFGVNPLAPAVAPVEDVQPTPWVPAANRWMIAVSVMTATFMVVLDSSCRRWRCRISPAIFPLRPMKQRVMTS